MVRNLVYIFCVYVLVLSGISCRRSCTDFIVKSPQGCYIKRPIEIGFKLPALITRLGVWNDEHAVASTLFQQYDKELNIARCIATFVGDEISIPVCIEDYTSDRVKEVLTKRTIYGVEFFGLKTRNGLFLVIGKPKRIHGMKVHYSGLRKFKYSVDVTWKPYKSPEMLRKLIKYLKDYSKTGVRDYIAVTGLQKQTHERWKNSAAEYAKKLEKSIK